MKLLFTLFFAILLTASAFRASAQVLPTDSVTGKIVYRGVIPVPADVTQAQAFGRAKIWLADAFTNKTILAEDAASGLLSGGGSVVVNQFLYTFRVRIQIKSGELNYRIDNFSWTTNEGRGVVDRGTPEEQRDSKLAIGRNSRAKILSSLDVKVRTGLTQLSQDLSNAL